MTMYILQQRGILAEDKLYWNGGKLQSLVFNTHRCEWYVFKWTAQLIDLCLSLKAFGALQVLLLQVFLVTYSEVAIVNFNELNDCIKVMWGAIVGGKAIKRQYVRDAGELPGTAACAGLDTVSRHLISDSVSKHPIVIQDLQALIKYRNHQKERVLSTSCVLPLRKTTERLLLQLLQNNLTSSTVTAEGWCSLPTGWRLAVIFR